MVEISSFWVTDREASATDLFLDKNLHHCQLSWAEGWRKKIMDRGYVINHTSHKNNDYSFFFSYNLHQHLEFFSESLSLFTNSVSHRYIKCVYYLSSGRSNQKPSVFFNSCHVWGNSFYCTSMPSLSRLLEDWMKAR